MDVRFRTVKGQFDLAYLDDIIILSNLPADHIEYVSQVLQLLSDAGVTLSFNKYLFFTDNVDYSEHLTSPSRQGIVRHTSKAILD